MKIAPIIHAINADAAGLISYRLVHTGQHFDEKMSNTFFKQLSIPEPDVNLNCGGGSQAEQTAAIMVAFERELLTNPTDLVLVVGDVTSTMACSIVAKKLNTKVAHVEAGIRSFDMSMPEEINRLVTDALTDYFYTTTLWAGENLKKAGVPEDRIIFVGNVMIDTLLSNRAKFTKPSFWDTLNLQANNYFVVTLHRPANVDSSENLKKLVSEIISNVNGLPVVFPIHPRTAKVLEACGIEATNLFVVEPLGYLEFNYLVENSMAVITDSGGITEETTMMSIPCLTLRDNTERPETVTMGTNELIGTNPNAIGPALQKVLQKQWKKGGIPEKWDGHAAERIVMHLKGL
jgi:UDP-N-acetylglucosamine 2-epimerase (non-hydrolysing)